MHLDFCLLLQEADRVHVWRDKTCCSAQKGLLIEVLVTLHSGALYRHSLAHPHLFIMQLYRTSTSRLPNAQFLSKNQLLCFGSNHVCGVVWGCRSSQGPAGPHKPKTSFCRAPKRSMHIYVLYSNEFSYHYFGAQHGPCLQALATILLVCKGVNLRHCRVMP